jgi:putative transposase
VGDSFSAARREDVLKTQAPVGGSWRMDETYIKVKGVWKYLCRAVDKQGKIVYFLLTAKRDMAAAKRSFERPWERTAIRTM